MRFRPGLRLLVSYETDPGWHHERLLLSPVINDDWVVLTPDDDVYAESLSDWKSVEVLSGLGTYPASVVGGVVQFGEPLGDEELLRLVATARETAVQERALRPGRIYPADCSVALSWDGGALAVPPLAWHARVRRRVARKQKAPRRVPAETKVPAAMKPPAGRLCPTSLWTGPNFRS